MQNVTQDSTSSKQKVEKVNVQYDIRTSSKSNSVQGKTKSETFSERRRYMSESSGSEEDCLSGVEPFMIDQEFEEDPAAKFLLNPDEDRTVDPETQARLEALLQAADEAAAALTRMRTDQNNPKAQPEKTSLVEACTDGDVHTVQKLLTEGGRSVHETSEEGESLLSLACSAGYFELAQVLLAMHANVEDRGIKGECTPLMEAASAGHLDIVRLLVAHGADVNAQSTTGNTPLMYGCAGGHTEVVQFLLEHGANVEDHNENGHTPLMEAASAGHVGLAKILLMHGAGINTHSNEFKESALTLACYKGHLDMVRFLLEAGADQEHKTDEMHTALMEASMDGHVEVARLLLDSGAQVNMPTDSFESPLTLAACGGHVDLAMLLIERGANIEEVNDEGYTPLMEAAREGHEEMVHLLLGQGANINAQTDETQETALTLACCGGFTDVADILLKGGANIELGASTPLMEAAQEGHLDLVKFLLQSGANVQAQTQTGDTALTYACENGHTDVADLLLQYGADLEHESEGGRTPLMKACRAGHLCTVQFLISKGANVKKQTTNNDHTPLSLACAGGHMSVVELLLSQNADPNHKLKDNSTMLIEAAKGGHTNVVQLLLDFPHSIQSLVINQYQQSAAPPSNLSVLPNQIGSRDAALTSATLTSSLPQPINFFSQSTGAVLQEVPEAIRIIPQEELNNFSEINKQQLVTSNRNSDPLPLTNVSKKSLLPKSQSTGNIFESTLTSAEAQQVRTQPLPLDFEEDILSSTTMEFLHKEDQNSTLIDYIKNRKKHYNVIDDGSTQKQQILEELHKVERELHGKQHSQSSVLQYPISQEQCPTVLTNALPNMLSMDLTMQQQQGTATCMQSPTLKLAIGDESLGNGTTVNQAQPAFYFTPLTTSVTVSLTTASTTTNASNQMVKFPSVLAHNEVQQYPGPIDESMIASLSAQQDLTAQDLSRVEYFTVPANATQLPMHTIYPYEYLDAAAVPSKDQSGAIYQAGFQAGINHLMQQKLACPTTTDNIAVIETTNGKSPPNQQHFISPPKQQQQTMPQTQCNLISTTQFQTSHHCQHQQQQQQVMAAGQVQQQPIGQVQVATQTPQMPSSDMMKKQTKMSGNDSSAKPKKNRVIRPQNQNQNFQHNHNFQIDPNSAITQYTNGVVNQPCANSVPLGMDVDSETESNHDTALTLACAGGHEELVELLLNRGADIEHRDKKGFTPLILAATAGHEKVVEILLNHNADIEAQSERTKDTPLSLACSGGRYEVVEILLKRNANKEHRNVSDYTPLSLAASGGYVNIIKLLLNHGAEINSRTGSKLGISPLMLAAMNGHTAAVKLLLDMGSDINAQIETNRNTALTLACFQGRHEVVSLLLDRKANVEHRAKTGLTPLMEAASGGYVDVGRVLLDKGADVNAPPVPSSRDTALTIAADKGHVRFVELLLHRGAMVEVKNKKGNSPMWLAANGGHLAVVELLYNVNADIDSQDNRKVSCLMAAFRKGHHKVVKWMVHSVTQFPSDQEMVRYISTVNDKDLAEKCQECAKIIRAAKETQALKANQNASILLEELDKEKNREETKRMAAARRRERKKKKKIEKKEERRKLLEENKKNENYDETVTTKKITENEEKMDEEVNVEESTLQNVVENGDKEEGDSGIDANSQGSCSSSELKAKDKRKDKKKKKTSNNSKANASRSSNKNYSSNDKIGENSKNSQDIRKSPPQETKSPAERDDFEATGNETYTPTQKKKEVEPKSSGTSPKQAYKREEGWKEVVRKSSVQTVSTNEPGTKKVSVPLNAISRVIGRGGSNINAIRGATGAHIEVEKQCKGQGERIITIKGTAESTKQAHSLIATLIKDPEADILQMLPKTIKPSSTTTTLWDKTQLGTKKVTGKVPSSTYVSSQSKEKIPSAAPSSSAVPSSKQTVSVPKSKITNGTSSNNRITAPRLAQAERSASGPQNRAPAHNSTTPRANVKYATSVQSQSFASKLATEPSGQPQTATLHQAVNLKPKPAPEAEHEESVFVPRMSNISNVHASPVKQQVRPEPTTSAPPNLQTFQSPRRTPLVSPPNNQVFEMMNTNIMPSSETSSTRSQTPNMKHHSIQPPAQNEEIHIVPPQNTVLNHLEYSLFNSAEQPMWRRNPENEQKPINFAAVTSGGGGPQQSHPHHHQQPKFIEDHSPPQVDASKAPGYRGGVSVCSPISSKSNASATTSPNLNAAYHDPQQKAPSHMVGAIVRPPQVSETGPCDLSAGASFYNDIFKQSSGILNIGKDTNPMMSVSYGQQPQVRSSTFSQAQQPPVLSMSRLNPKAPDFSSSMYNSVPKMPTHYNGFTPSVDAGNPMFCTNGKMDNYRGAGPMQNQIPLMQLHQPLTQQQTEMISGMTVGLTLQNLARVTGGEILENGPDGLGMINTSPNMSPNLNIPPNDKLYDDRKMLQPQPIGTERANRKYYQPNMDNNWIMANDNKMRWSGPNLERMSLNRMVEQTTGLYKEPQLLDSFKHGLQLDGPHTFPNNAGLPPFMQIGGIRQPDFVPGVVWDTNLTQNFMGDKHIWPMKDWKE